MKNQPLLAMLPLALMAQASAQTLYSHGNPTAEEQYMLELINRARTNPTAEIQRLLSSGDPNVQLGITYFKVDQARIRREFATYSVQPPLAMNAELLAAARRHSNDMARKNFQSHTGSDGSSISQRIAAASYRGSFLSENIYSNLVSSPFFAHAAFVIDWGTGPGGVQPGLGHRSNAMGLGNATFREVGVGITTRSGADADKYGKLAVTQDFGTNVSTTWFLLGVAYQDENGNGICDPGEGLPGIRVQPSVGHHYAVTSASGGYAIPFLQSPGEATVAFSGGGLKETETRAFSMIRQNVKVDLRTVSTTITLSVQKIDSLAGETGKTGGSASFRVVRKGPSDSDLKVTFSRPTKKKAGVADPSDYKLSAVKPATMKAPGQRDATFDVVIPKGRTYADIKISAKKDKKDEPTEKAKFSMVKSGVYQVATPNSVTISIKD